METFLKIFFSMKKSDRMKWILYILSIKPINTYEWYIQSLTDFHNVEVNDYLKFNTDILNNQKILSRFAILGIYDYTKFLYLNYTYIDQPYKVSTKAMIYYTFLESRETVPTVLIIRNSTTEKIIYKLFELTIFSNKQKRRR
jgi:hypothetical protein